MKKAEMKVIKILWCTECGTKLEDGKAAEHEKLNCMPWKIGDRVIFQYGLLCGPATITELGPPVEPGGTRIIYVRSDIEFEEPDPFEATTGRDFFVPANKLRILEQAVRLPHGSGV